VAKTGFSAGEAIKFGWQETKNNFWKFSALFVGIFIIATILSVALNALQGNNSAEYMMMNLIATIFNIFISIGIITITLRIYNKKPFDFFDLFANVHLILKYFGASILFGLIVFLGCLFFIIPGIILAIRMQFFAYIMVDQQLGPIEALKKSAEITKSCTFSLFLFGILLIIINLCGMFVLGIGLLASFPTTLLAMAYVYKKLSTEDLIDFEEPAINQ